VKHVVGRTDLNGSVDLSFIEATDFRRKSLARIVQGWELGCSRAKWRIENADAGRASDNYDANSRARFAI